MPTLKHISTLPLDIINETENPPRSSNSFNYITGLAIMFLNKIRHEVKGYTSARGFDFKDINRAINYDFRVIKRWMDYLDKFEEGASNFVGKNILELGPGADLGIGLISLAEGAQSYNALDVHNLVKGTPDLFYQLLFDHLEKDPYLNTNIEALKEQLHLTLSNKNDRLNYLVRKDFDLSVFQKRKIDLILSNSAFQQFDDPEKTIALLSKIVIPGAYFVALIDLKTHTRWINKRDPLNIYRYPDTIYQSLKFKGSQNRFRPNEFKGLLEKYGWANVQVSPRLSLESKYIQTINGSLNTRFCDPAKQMEILTCIICAKKT